MTGKLATFVKGCLDSFSSKPPVFPSKLSTNDSESAQRNMYGDALFHELQYRRRVKQMHDIELEVERHHRLLRDSAYERNMHVRIMKLPVEILSLIFHWMRHPSSSDNPAWHDSFMFKQDTADWAVVTWVCRYWRNIALNDLSLWTVVPHQWSMWTPAIIERSRNAGLRVELVDGPNSHSLYEHVLKHSARISQLCITRADTLDYLIKNFNLDTTPRLEKLSIELSIYHPSTLPTHFFKDCEKLHYLALTNIKVDLTPSSFPSIIRRSLRHLRLSQCLFLKIEDFKPAIQRIASLESLSLYNTLSKNPVPVNYAPISLTCLKSLHLDEDLAPLTWFFNNFSLTMRHTYARVTTRFSHEQHEELLKLLATLSRPGVLGDSVTMMHSVAFSSKVDWFESTAIVALILRGQHAPNDTTLGRLATHEPPNLTLTLAPESLSIGNQYTFQLERDKYLSIFADVFRHFEWTNLHELILTGLNLKIAPEKFGKTLGATFGTLPNIRVVHVGPACTRPLVDALWLDAAQRTPRVEAAPREAVAFPGLQEIYVKHVSFSPKREGEQQVAISRFIDCLLGRVERGVPILKLALTSCFSLTKLRANQLAEVVPDVVWDGKYTPDQVVVNPRSRPAREDMEDSFRIWTVA